MACIGADEPRQRFATAILMAIHYNLTDDWQVHSNNVRGRHRLVKAGRKEMCRKSTISSLRTQRLYPSETTIYLNARTHARRANFPKQG